MRIAHVIWSFTIGGIETMLVDIIAEQVKSANVAIFIVNEKIDTKLISTLDERCKVFRFHRKEGSRNILPFVEFNICISTFKPDIIHYHYTGLAKLTIGKYLKVITIHNVHLNLQDLNQYDAIYAISNAVKNYVRSQGFNAITIENGIKIKDIARHVIPNVPHKLKFVQIGRLFHQHKGQHIVIEAINILVNHKGFNNFTFDFIGDGESREYLEHLVHEYNLSKYVFFIGNQSRDYVYSHLKDYDLCLQPSISEGFGLTVAEAMAAKVPVIVSNIPGTMEVIDHGKYGFSFDVNNSESLAEKIEEVIPLIDKMTYLEEALNFSNNNFDVKKTAQKYLSEYRKLLEIKKRHFH